jgi:hypothetical protein
MSQVSHVMIASHLKALQTTFDNGISYHVTQPERVQELLALVDRYAKPFDPRIQESGTAFLRLNVTVKRAPNDLPWSMSGGALMQRSMTDEISQAVTLTETNNPNINVTEQQLTAWVLNEWDRYSVVFELVLTVKDK